MRVAKDLGTRKGGWITTILGESSGGCFFNLI